MVSPVGVDDRPGPVAFAALLARARRVAGLTQQELAARAGTSVRTISNLERASVRRAHTETARRLAVALGLTGPALTAFVEAARGRSPARPSYPADPARQLRPHQLPADVAHFTGRAQSATDLVRLLSEPHVTAPHVVVLAGAGGMGKSTLAAHVANRVKDRYPDGQLFAALHGASPHPSSPAEALTGLLHGLGVTGPNVPTDVDAMAAMYRSLLDERRVLVLLDDARDSAQVRPLLPAAAGCAAVVTSRRSLPELPLTHVELPALDGHEAHELFTRIVGERRVAAEPDAAAAVVDACGGLPLAIRIAAGRLVGRPNWSVRSIADRLADGRRRLDELRVGDLQVRNSFAVSFHALSDDAAHAFRLLGVLDQAECALPVVARLLDLGEPDAEGLLDELVNVHLLDSPAPERYRFHDLLHSFARELAETELTGPERRAALVRTLEYAVCVARASTAYLHPAEADEPTEPDRKVFADNGAALRWQRDMFDGLVALAEQATGEPGVPVDLPARLLTELAQVLHATSAWPAMERLARRVLDLAGETGPADLAGRAHALLARSLTSQSRTREAIPHHERALEIFRSLGLRRREGSVLHNIAMRVVRDRRHADALGLLDDALRIAVEQGDRSLEAWTLWAIGTIRYFGGDVDEAADPLERSLELFRSTGDRRGVTAALNNLGHRCVRAGRPAEALAHLDECLVLTREIENRDQEAETVDSIGEAYAAAGDWVRARKHYEQALAIRTETRDAHAEARTRTQLGSVWAKLGEPARAREQWADAARIFEGMGAAEADDVRMLLTGEVEDRWFVITTGLQPAPPPAG